MKALQARRTLPLAVSVVLFLAATAMLSTAVAAGEGAQGPASQAPSGSAGAGGSTKAAGNGKITLNLKNADIRALIETVSDATGRNFIVDPRVKGNVTVISSTPMGEKALWKTFLEILEVNGYAAVEGKNVTKIVPEVDAKQYGATGRPKPPAPADVVTRVVKVNNIPAAQLVPILRPLVPQYGHLAAYPPANMLIISDRAANVRRLARIVHSMDESQSQNVDVVQLQHASAKNVAQIVNAISKSGGGNNGPEVKALADPRTNSVLLTGDPAQRKRMRQLISRLDQPLEKQGNSQVVYLNYADATDLAQILEKVVTGQSSSGGGSGQGSGGSASASAAAAALSGGGNGKISIVADKATNALIVTAPPQAMSTIKTLVRELDVRRAQVLVDAIIAEISSDKAAELGIQWAAEGGGSTNSPAAITNFNQTNSGLASLAGAPQQVLPQLEGLTLGVGRLNSNGVNFGVLLRALASSNDTNILSTPTLTTLDNEEAEITVGQEVPFVTGQYTNGTTNASNTVNPFQTIERKEVGIKLKITPKINEGNSVELKIQQEVSSVQSTATSGYGLITNKRTINTNVICNDDQTIVLGGLIDTHVEQNEQRVPVLGSIPVLGQLFRYRNSKKTKRNLMVFIRPRILRSGVDTARYTQQKYQYLRALEQRVNKGGINLMPGSKQPTMPPIDLRSGNQGSSPTGSSGSAAAGSGAGSAPPAGKPKRPAGAAGAADTAGSSGASSPSDGSQQQ
ncbi:MAG TPA: type II secretion system secretin GspD [Gammaproteobacteria bacterium]|nr:type II secretion system secretin GspD [Gammaproteobacteria bacterium]